MTSPAVAPGGRTVLEEYADAGPVARVLARVEEPRRGRALPLTLVGAIPLAAALVLLSDGLLDRLLLLGAVSVFAVTASLAWAGSLSGGFDWLVPAVLRGVEYGVLIRAAAVVAPDAVPAAFAVCAALAFHHYDTVYRVGQTGSAPASWVAVAGGGFEVRMLVVAVLTLAGAGALTRGLWLLTALLVTVYVVESAVAWAAWTRRARVAATVLEKGELV